MEPFRHFSIAGWKEVVASRNTVVEAAEGAGGEAPGAMVGGSPTLIPLETLALAAGENILHRSLPGELVQCRFRGWQQLGCCSERRFRVDAVTFEPGNVPPMPRTLDLGAITQEQAQQRQGRGGRGRGRGRGRGAADVPPAEDAASTAAGGGGGAPAPAQRRRGPQVPATSADAPAVEAVAQGQGASGPSQQHDGRRRNRGRGHGGEPRQRTEGQELGPEAPGPALLMPGGERRGGRAGRGRGPGVPGARVTSGLEAAPSGEAAAAVTGSDTDSSDEEGVPSCVVCCERLTEVKVGPCGHRQVCAICCLRLRLCYDDTRCPLCKTEEPQASHATPPATTNLTFHFGDDDLHHEPGASAAVVCTVRWRRVGSMPVVGVCHAPTLGPRTVHTQRVDRASRALMPTPLACAGAADPLLAAAAAGGGLCLL